MVIKVLAAQVRQPQVDLGGLRGSHAVDDTIIECYSLGIVKSALAIRVGHELADEFPDGQMYVDLCGATPGVRPLRPVEALDRLLRRLGVAGDAVPPHESDAATLFRSLTADRRSLLVLDNAAGKDQVLPLLPGGGGCGVVVTSRQPLPSVDTDCRIRLEILSEPSALRLLADVSGRGDGRSEADRRLVGLSGGLPLAVRIVGGRLACRTDLSAAAYAERLADDSRRLDELRLDDLEIRASIRTSYEMLGGDPDGRAAAKAFRMLGILHVPDVAPGVIAAMMEQTSPEAARAALDRLVDTQLVEPVPPGRYRLHDLVSLVAAECAATEDSPSDREGAIRRAIVYYAAGLHRADLSLRRNLTHSFGIPPTLDGAAGPAIDGSREARIWIDGEILSLVSVLEQALTMPSRASLGRLSLWFSESLWDNLDIRCEWHVAHCVSKFVLDAARACDDPEWLSCGCMLHGRSEASLGNYYNAAIYLERALHLFRTMGNEIGIGLALNGTGVVETLRGDHDAALARFREGLDLVRHRGPPALLRSLLGNMSVTYGLVGDLSRARSTAEEKLAMSASDSDARRHMTGMLSLSAISCLQGDYSEAVRSAGEVLGSFREAGARQGECEALIVRAEANRRCGHLTEAWNDAAQAANVAEASNYRYARAAALQVESRILVAMGRDGEADAATIKVTEAFAQLGSSNRDRLIALLLDDERGPAGRAVSVGGG